MCLLKQTTRYTNLEFKERSRLQINIWDISAHGEISKTRRLNVILKRVSTDRQISEYPKNVS